MSNVVLLLTAMLGSGGITAFVKIFVDARKGKGSDPAVSAIDTTRIDKLTSDNDALRAENLALLKELAKYARRNDDTERP